MPSALNAAFGKFAILPIKCGAGNLKMIIGLTFKLMYLAKIKRKSQVTVPAAIMKRVGLKIGDFLEFALQEHAITIYPKKLSEPLSEPQPYLSHQNNGDLETPI